MKKIMTLLLVLSASIANAQAYKGKGDIKAQVGANIQTGTQGIFASGDYGIGENISIGLSANYSLSANQEYFNDSTLSSESPAFLDRVDLKARFNANIGNVLGLDKKMDVYPGLDLGTRNFGIHAGFRYFFTDGFGVFGEAGLPLAKYSTNASVFSNYNNQFAFNVGASFNL
ncbi:DUF6646 family protein [Flavobacterium psychrophilum]|uniref:DUF6646 family protein n=1 Tax=Flavobacterium psychrophilum TaxID=96345 RepID=UPI000B7C35AD|nr:DUF6646 family protein [Flavobacterium psychrophilum]EKT3957534.1 hypothetical protein [Flavobacterium psychrophilum]EKT4501662.1 hypothetical protein [Flavobacterium psychrophilum]ELY1979530.1 hypothetical protein [Flavobacterium psychrophilum]QRE61727.1 hypothetical protein H1R87_00710 [Flavobacterium psychrophilum]QRE63916.1 hypothetical protein H1R86_00710 [Flavobacterium psychrophilum]